jgi:hypothetical protein
LGLFPAAPRSSSPQRAPLLPKLRGQFAEFLDEGSPARLRLLASPTCVGFRYGHPVASLEAFLGSPGPANFATRLRSPSPLGSRGGLSLPASYGLGRALHLPAWPAALRPPFGPCGHTVVSESPPIPLRLRSPPRLRPRLTLSGRAFLRNPSACGGPDSHRPSRYSYRHSHFLNLQRKSPPAFPGPGTLPYHPVQGPRLRCRA